ANNDILDNEGQTGTSKDNYKRRTLQQIKYRDQANNDILDNEGQTGTSKNNYKRRTLQKTKQRDVRKS
ncbi:hypothetical protein, partial [Salmonella sp. s54925]|uniref:hypothetical protein n=1 Tax=Salmonella sp. s54925 TaxID=3159674 RepID=UPI00398119CE